MKALLLLSVLISLASPALARIGETPEQCEARYGKPVDVREDGSYSAHEKSGLRVQCEYHEGKCDFIRFTNVAKDAKGTPLPLTDLELKTLLEANSNGQPWKKETENALTQSTFWISGEHLSAVHNRGVGGFLSISTKTGEERIRAKVEDHRKARLKGF